MNEKNREGKSDRDKKQEEMEPEKRENPKSDEGYGTRPVALDDKPLKTNKMIDRGDG